MWREVDGRHLASAQEMGNVFHLHKRHGRLLELDAGRYDIIYESVERLSAR